MATANTKVTVDTSQAQVAIKGLETAWVNASAQLNVVGKVLDFVASKWDGLNKTIQDSATFMDSVKNEAGIASVQMAMSVTEGQIKPMELARQQNILMQGSLRLTQDQFDLVAKSAVALADATGGDANQAFADLSRSLVSGSVRSLAQFGIQIDEGGTKAERTAKVMDHLKRTYGDYAVEVTNASDALAKTNNTIELQQYVAARSLDSLAKRYQQFKEFYISEFVPNVIDSLAGTKLSKSAQLETSIENAMEAAIKGELTARRAVNDALTQSGKLQERNGEYAIRYSGQQVALAAKALETLQADRENQQRKIDLLQMEGKSRMDVWLAGQRLKQIDSDILKITKQFGPTIDEASLAMRSFAADIENAVKPAVLDVGQMLNSFFGWKIGGEEDIKKLKERAKTATAEIEAEKFDAEQVIRMARYEARVAEFARDKELADQAIRDQQAADLKYELDKSAEQDRIMKDREAARVQNVKNAELEIKEAKDKAAAEDKRRMESIKSKTIEVSNVVLGAIFAEKKARDGLSRSEYLMKQLAVYMKGQALRYAAEAIGHTAQALAASVLAPQAAPALWAAAAADAAAAAAFGAGSAVAGKMAGGGKSPSSGSKSESASKGPQREAVGGTTEGRGSVTIVIGGRGVLFGNPDELARKLSEIMNSANRRGRI